MGDIDVVVLGGVGVDTIVRVDKLAVPGGDIVNVPPIRDYVAHSGNGVALGFHALGLRTVFADFIGDDPQGRLVRDRYAAVGLDFRALPAPNGTPRSVNLVDREGRRFSFHDPRHPADLNMPPEVYVPLLARARHLHVGSTRALAAFAEARRLGVTTSTDVHAWDGTSDWGRQLSEEADVVFLSAAGAPQAIDEVMRGILARGRAGLVVATEGADGSRVLVRGEPEVRRFPAVAPERPVIDSNGAGDAYSTAFLSRWFAGRPVEECVLAGAVSGAFACGADGTHEELITADQLAAAATRAGSIDKR